MATLVGGKSNLVIISFTDNQGTNYNIRLDTVTNHTSNETSTATQYPTSRGTPVTDNVYRNPVTFMLQGEIGIDVASDCYGENANRIEGAKNLFREIKNNAYMVTIDAVDGTYDNMYLLDIATSNSNTNAYVLNVTLKFKELPRVDIEYGTVITEKTGGVTETEETETTATTETVSQKARASLGSAVVATLKETAKRTAIGKIIDAIASLFNKK